MLGFSFGLASLAVGLAACDEPDEPEGDTAAAPRIVTQPADASVVVGQTATFAVTAEGSGLAYQWQSSTDDGASWTNLPSATAASYTTPPTGLSDGGSLYRVLITAAGVSLSSSAARLTVSAEVVAPTIVVHPAAQIVTEPAAVMFFVTASGTTPAYQWQLSTDDGANWTDIEGATSSGFDSGPTSASMSGRLYRVRASNGSGSVTSMAALLTVNASAVTSPGFTQMPADQQVTEGEAAVFSAAVAGYPVPTLQWQRSNDDGGSWADIANATSASYNTGAATLADHGARFRLVASNSAGSATSDAARLVVMEATDPVAPEFTEHPAYRVLKVGTSAHFSATATGTPTPTYQWQVSTDNGANWSKSSAPTTAATTHPPRHWPKTAGGIVSSPVTAPAARPVARHHSPCASTAP